MKHNYQKYCRGILYLIVIAVISIACGCQNYYSASNEHEGTQEQTSDYNETEIVSDTQTASEDVQKADIPKTQDTTVDDGAEILRRFQNVDWETLEPRTFKDEDWPTNIVYLAELTEPRITMYGYNDEQYHGRGVAIDMEGSRYYFDWEYHAPMLVSPRIYWDAQKSQLQAALHLYTGTGVAGDEIHILEETQGNMTDYCLDMEKYCSLLAERIDYSYNAQTDVLTFYDKKDGKELDTVDMSWLKEEDKTEEFDCIELGSITQIELGETMRLMVTPGYVTKKVVFPRYEHMPMQYAEISLEETDGQKQFAIRGVQRCLSDDELCDLAEQYYKAHSETGFVPPIIEVDNYMEDGQVLIHLYEIVDDHTATYDWYTVSRTTGKGTNLLFEEIDLLSSSKF